MSQRKKSKRTRMIRISDSDDESPSALQHETLSIPSTRYERLSNRNLSSSTHILHVTVPCSEQPNAVVLPDPASEFPFDLDHLNEDFIPSKHRRTYVSILTFLSFWTWCLPCRISSIGGTWWLLIKCLSSLWRNGKLAGTVPLHWLCRCWAHVPVLYSTYSQI